MRKNEWIKVEGMSRDGLSIYLPEEAFRRS